MINSHSARTRCPIFGFAFAEGVELLEWNVCIEDAVVFCFVLRVELAFSMRDEVLG